jgi:hypothetical protein
VAAAACHALRAAMMIVTAVTLISLVVLAQTAHLRRG